MISSINNRPYNIFNSFHENARTAQIKKDRTALRGKRYKVSDEPDTPMKIKIASGSIIGTALAMLICAKFQKKDISKIKEIFKIEYRLPEMIGISVGSITGGIASGLMFDKKNTVKEKLDEGVFQLLNSTLPPAIVLGLIKLAEKSSKTNTNLTKTGIIAVGIAAGMYFSAKLANLINDPKDKVPDRKLNIKDSVVNIDDAIGALVLAKIPFAQKIHLEHALPAIYAWCGYRAGEAN